MQEAPEEGLNENFLFCSLYLVQFIKRYVKFTPPEVKITPPTYPQVFDYFFAISSVHFHHLRFLTRSRSLRSFARRRMFLATCQWTFVAGTRASAVSVAAMTMTTSAL